jgi:hypothetical protein
MSRLKCLGVIICILLASDTHANVGPGQSKFLRTPVQINSSEEINVLEAVFRQLMRRCYQQRPRKVYFLSVKQADPADMLMDRFSGSRLSIKKRSEVVDFHARNPNEQPIRLAIRSIEQRDSVTAEVKASCGIAILDGYVYVYRVAKKKGVWRITREKRIGVA